MKLTHFRNLLAVVETGSLRAAGRHLGLAQPVITRSIQELERELGVPLFERNAKGVKLTETGQMFVRRVESFQSELQRARDEIAQQKGVFTGEVSIALSPLICLSLMPPAISQFTKKYPEVVVKISESLFQPVENDVADGLIDFWIGPFDRGSESPRFTAEHLLDNDRKIVGRKNHPLSSAMSLKELADARWVRTSRSVHSSESDFDAVLERAGLPRPRNVIHSGSMLITILTVANTDLLTMLPQHLFRFPRFLDLIQTFDNIEPIPMAPICIVWRQGLCMTPIAERLCDLMRKAARNYARQLLV